MSSAPITFTNAQLETLAHGLSALDGLQTKDGFQPFKFDDDTTWLIAVNTDLVQKAVNRLIIARKSLAKQHGVVDHMKITNENAEKVAAFMESVDALLAKEVPVEGLVRIEKAKLNVAKNGIPPGVLGKLMGILE